MFITYLLILFFCLKFLGSFPILFDDKLSACEKRRAFIISISIIIASMAVFKLSRYLSTYLNNLNLKLK